MTPIEIENAVFELENVRIVIRTPGKTKLGDYNYLKKAAGQTTILDWLDTRILPLTDGAEVVVVDGTGVSPNRRTKMSTLRASYDHD